MGTRHTLIGLVVAVLLITGLPPAGAYAEIIEDRTPPLCVPDQLSGQAVTVWVQDSESGLAWVDGLALTSQTRIRSADAPTGEQGPLPVIAARWYDGPPAPLRVHGAAKIFMEDQAGNSTVCYLGMLVAGHPKNGLKFVDVPAHLSSLTIRNDEGGFRNIRVRVNEDRFVVHVAGGEEQTVDISAAFFEGNGNEVEIAGLGKPAPDPMGLGAGIVIWDGRR